MCNIYLSRTRKRAAGDLQLPLLEHLFGEITRSRSRSLQGAQDCRLGQPLGGQKTGSELMRIRRTGHYR